VFHERWVAENRRLTRKAFQAIERMPAPVKAAIGAIPLLGNIAGLAFTYSENHKFALIRMAKELDRKGDLGRDAKRHLHAYERALANEQQAYNAFLKSFESHL